MRKLLCVLLLLSLLVVSTSSAFATTQRTPSGLSFSKMEADLDALMLEHIGFSTPGAAIVVVYEGEIILSRGYGLADIDSFVPVDPAVTVFEYGSINKPFVWVCVMQLVEQGLLDLDIDVCTYLPESFQFEKPFTMRDLMNHSAGFEDFLLGMFSDEQTLERYGSLENALLDLQPQQIYPAGVWSAYSNWGTALAGFIVEQISGTGYAAYERENILLPSKMHHTLNQPDWLNNHAFLANKAQGYVANGEGDFSKSEWAYIPIYPDGALNGTAEDLAAFIIALTPRAGEPSPLFVNTATLETLLSPSSYDPIHNPGTYHGFLDMPGALLTLGHGGGTIAFRTDFAFVPEMRFGYVLLTNSASQDLLPAVSKLLLGSNEADTLVKVNHLPSAKTVEGHYVPARRYGGNFVEFFSYAGLSGNPMIRIRALDENTIQLFVNSSVSALYAQTEPNVYQILDASSSPELAYFYPRLCFQSEEGLPKGIHLGNGSDFTSLPAGRSMPLMMASLVLVMVCGGFFFIAPVVLLILFFVRRKKKVEPTRFGRFQTGFLLCGTMLTLNNLLLFSLFGINPFRSAFEVAPFIWINYALTGFMAVLFAGSLLSWCFGGKARRMQKVMFIVSTVLSVLLILVLQNWQFFVLI